MKDKNKKPAQAAKPAAFPGRGRVAIVKCGTYDGQEVQIAVQRAVELLGGLERVLSAGEKPLVHDSRIIKKPVRHTPRFSKRSVRFCRKTDTKI